MTKDRVHPLKLEDAETGGTETDFAPTELDKNEDYVDCRGITLQSDISNDDAVWMNRDSSGNLVFNDATAGAHTLSSVVSGGFDVNNLILDVAGGIVYSMAEQAVTQI